MSIEWAPMLLQAAGALLAVLGLAWLLARAARRGGLAQGGIQAGRLEMQASLALGPRQRAVLLRVDGREVLLVAGPEGTTLLGWLPGP